jgi:hypothetical protein
MLKKGIQTSGSIEMKAEMNTHFVRSHKGKTTMLL